MKGQLNAISPPEETMKKWEETILTDLMQASILQLLNKEEVLVGIDLIWPDEQGSGVWIPDRLNLRNTLTCTLKNA